jgi:hypothetical protein
MIAVRNSSLAALLLGALLALMRSPGAHRTAVPVTAPATRPGD